MQTAPSYTLDLAQHLRTAADNIENDHISLSEIVALHGTSTLGAILTLLAIPSLIPSMGVGWVLSLGIMAVATAMLLGREEVYLPRRVKNVKIRRDLAAKLLRGLAKVYGWTGKIARPRLGILTQRTAKRWLAIKVFIMAFIIFLPIPAGNTMPAIPLVILGPALIFSDGIGVLIALVAAVLALIATSAFVGSMLWVAWQSSHIALEWLSRFFGA
jgi:hypothetical protein